jgi:hypothetical protein
LRFIEMRGPIDRISKFMDELEGRLLPGRVIVVGCDPAECDAEIVARRARGELRDVTEIVSICTSVPRAPALLLPH